MVAKILMDNRRCDSSWECEHGFSMYLETESHKCLVDVGHSDGFLANADKWGIQVEDIDYLFLSHGHSDHVGGLPFFLEKNKKAKIIVSKHALEQEYYSVRKGLRKISSEIDTQSIHSRFWKISADTIIEKDIRIIANISNDYPQPKANRFLMKNVDGRMLLDDFNHELVFCFGKEVQLLCSGCAHRGVQNILKTVKKKTTQPIKAVIGGFHLPDADDINQYESAKEIDNIAANLKFEYPDTMFYTGHCTGDEAFGRMKKTLGPQLEAFYVGKEITIQ